MKGKDSDNSQPRLRSRRTRRWVDLPGGTSAMVIAFLNSLASNTISACRRFARKWFASRPLEPLLRGFPAVLAVACLILSSVFVGERLSSGNRAKRYGQSAVEALRRGDVAASSLWIEKLAALGTPTTDLEFRLAQLAARQGERRQARDLLQRLAPRDRCGHPEAHFWVARDLLSRQKPLSPATFAAVEYHLQQARRSQNVRAEADAALGHLYWAAGQRQRGAEQMSRAAGNKPELYAVLTGMYRSQNDFDSARRAATRGLQHFRALAEAAPDTRRYRMQWALFATLVEDYQAAIDILGPLAEESEGGQRARLRQALATAHLNKFQNMVPNSPAETAEQLEALDQAVRYGPDSPHVLQVVAALSGRKIPPADRSPSTAFPRELLERALADGVAPAVGHLIIGLRYLKNASPDRARTHLELAQRSNPEIPLLLSHLARELTDQAEPDLPQARKLIEMAARLTDDPRIQATRTRLLDRLGPDADVVIQ